MGLGSKRERSFVLVLVYQKQDALREPAPTEVHVGTEVSAPRKQHRALGLVGGGSGGAGYFGEILFGQDGGGARGDNAVAPRTLRLIKSVVSELEKEIDAIRGFIEGGQSDGDG